MARRERGPQVARGLEDAGERQGRRRLTGYGPSMKITPIATRRLCTSGVLSVRPPGVRGSGWPAPWQSNRSLRDDLADRSTWSALRQSLVVPSRAPPAILRCESACKWPECSLRAWSGSGPQHRAAAIEANHGGMSSPGRKQGRDSTSHLVDASPEAGQVHQVQGTAGARSEASTQQHIMKQTGLEGGRWLGRDTGKERGRGSAHPAGCLLKGPQDFRHPLRHQKLTGSSKWLELEPFTSAEEEVNIALPSPRQAGCRAHRRGRAPGARRARRPSRSSRSSWTRSCTCNINREYSRRPTILKQVSSCCSCCDPRVRAGCSVLSVLTYLRI